MTSSKAKSPRHLLDAEWQGNIFDRSRRLTLLTWNRDRAVSGFRLSASPAEKTLASWSPSAVAALTKSLSPGTVNFQMYCWLRGINGDTWKSLLQRYGPNHPAVEVHIAVSMDFSFWN
jgi:hypothetical protein